MDSPVQTLEELEEHALDDLNSCEDLAELEDFRIDVLGRSGRMREVLQSMGEVPEERRAEVGRRANSLKSTLETRLEEKKQELKQQADENRARDRWVDATLPGRTPGPGGSHPISLTLRRIGSLFRSMGFRSVEGPEVETDWYNFEALNIPEDHPARDMHDTFYLEDGRVLRTHTSPVQIHVMEKEDPPFQIIAPGRVFRRDADRTHSPMFHQVEGLWVDETTTFSELKGTLRLFLTRFFDREIDLRFRPSYFPFTEPSAEVDIAFEDREGKSWLEILGAGQVDPAVFEAVGYDPDRYQGFAFGMGVERLAMLRYGIDELPLFFRNELPFLKQFRSEG